MADAPTLHQVHTARALGVVVAQVIGRVLAAMVARASHRTLRYGSATCDRSTHRCGPCVTVSDTEKALTGGLKKRTLGKAQSGISTATADVVIKLRGHAGPATPLVAPHVALVQPTLEQLAAHKSAHVHALWISGVFPRRAAAHLRTN